MNLRTGAQIFFILFLCACAESDDSPRISDKAPDGHYLRISGASANEFLSSSVYAGLTIQVIYAKGFEPAATTVTQLTGFLNSRINKPAGISIHMNELPDTGKEVFTLADLKDIEYRYREQFTQNDRLTLFIFIADGIYSEDPNLLGIAYQNTSVALFGSNIHAHSGGPDQPSRQLLEATVLDHEIGHLLGLVNNGTAALSPHQHLGFGRHCKVETCLMHWTWENTEFIVDKLKDRMYPPDIDSQCLADLRANDGR